jgi:hypothetical protein
LCLLDLKLKPTPSLIENAMPNKTLNGGSHIQDQSQIWIEFLYCLTMAFANSMSRKLIDRFSFWSTRTNSTRQKLEEVVGREEPDATFVKTKGTDPEQGGPGLSVPVLHHYVDALDVSGILMMPYHSIVLDGNLIARRSSRSDHGTVCKSIYPNTVWKSFPAQLYSRVFCHPVEHGLAHSFHPTRMTCVNPF